MKLFGSGLLCLALALALTLLSQSVPVSSFTCPTYSYEYFKPRTYDFVPTLRLMMGGYNSQHALNYAAYMYMTTLNKWDVSWYPTTDHDTYWDYFGDGDGQEKYPDAYWDWMNEDNDKVDVNFEFWPSQELQADSSAHSVYSNGQVIKGYTTSYGEIGWWVPKYFAEEYPEIIFISDIQSNTQLRELLINSSKEYIDEYKSDNRDPDFETLYDIPDGSRPIIWGSADNYAMSNYSYELKENLLGGLNVDFVTTSQSGETQLSSLIEDMYNNHKYFIANIYVPDDNFAKNQEFEQISLPDNPDQSLDDPCYKNYECAWPVQPLAKLVNHRLLERFPEGYEFFQAFELPASQITLLINKYFDVQYDSSMTGHEKWLNASCEWLKDERSEEYWNDYKWDINVNLEYYEKKNKKKKKKKKGLKKRLRKKP